MDSNGIKCEKLYIIPGERSFWRSTKGLKFKAWQDAVSITRTFLSSKEHLNLSGISFRVGLEEKEPVKTKMNLSHNVLLAIVTVKLGEKDSNCWHSSWECRTTTHTVRSSRFLLECGIEVILSLKKKMPFKIYAGVASGALKLILNHSQYRQLCRLNSWENRTVA